MSVGIYFSGLYVKIYKIKSGFGAERGDICFPLKTPSSCECQTLSLQFKTPINYNMDL